MKSKRALLFRIGAVALLIAIGAVMMVIGRGHTMYFDNKTTEVDGKTYKTPYKVEVYVDGEQVAKLYDRERGMATVIGGKFSATFVVTQEKGGAEQTVEFALTLPRDIDGLIINLPAYLAGLPEEAYLSEFVPTPEEPSEEEEIPPGEFGDLGELGDI